MYLMRYNGFDFWQGDGFVKIVIAGTLENEIDYEAIHPNVERAKKYVDLFHTQLRAWRKSKEDVEIRYPESRERLLSVPEVE